MAGPGTWTLTFIPNPGQCANQNTIDVTVNPAPTATPASLSACGAGSATFNLTTLNNTVSGGAGTVNWYTNMAATNPVPNPAAFTTGSTTVYATVTNGGCTSTPAAVTLTVTPLPTANPAGPLSACGSGSATFNLTTLDNTVSGGAGTVNWYTNMAATNPVANPAAFTSGSTTVYATVTNGGCTSTPTAVTLTVTPLPTANPAGPLSACGAGSATFNLTTLNNTVSGGAGTVNWYTNMAATNPVPNPSSFTTGSTTVYATVTNGGCTSTPTAVTLIVTPPPTANPAGPLSACGSGSATFNLTTLNNTVSGGVGTVNWFTDMGATNPIPNPAAFTSGNTTVYATVSSGGCSSSAVPVTLTVTGPTANTPAQPYLICYTLIPFSFSDNLTAIISQINGGNASLTVNWYLDAAGTNAIDPFDPNDILDLIAGGPNQTLYATVSDGSCESATVPVNVILTPNTAINPAPIGPFCLGAAPVPLAATQSGVTGNWSGPGVNANTFNPTAAGVGTWTLTFTPNPGQCANPANLQVTVSNTTTPALAPIGPFCQGDAPLALATTQSGVAGNWSGPGVNANTFNPTAAGIGTWTLTFTPNPNQCANTNSLQVTVTAAGTPALTPIGPFCAGDPPVVLPASQGGYTGNWSGPGVGGNVFDPGAAGSGLVTLTFTPGPGQCGLPNTLFVDVSDVPASPAGPLFGCPGANGQAGFDLTAIDDMISNGNGAVNWYVNLNATVPIPNPGNYVISANTTVYATVSDGFCESANPAAIQLILLPPPAANLAALTACDTGNGTGLFDLTEAEATVTGGQPYSVSWFFDAAGNTPIPSPGSFTSAAGTVYAFVSDGNCSTGAPVSLSLQAAPDIAPIGDQQSCGAFILPPITGAGLSGGQAYYSGPGGTGTAYTPGASINTGALLYAYDGAPGCADEEAFFVTINPLPVLQLQVSTPIGCNGDANGSLNLTVSSGAPSFTYDWNLDALDGQEDPSGLPAGTYSVTVTDEAGCMQSASISLNEPPAITSTCMATNPAITPGGSEGEGMVNFSGGTPPYSVSLAGPVSESGNSPAGGTVIFSNLLQGLYTVTIEDANGCTESCSFIVNGPGCTLAAGFASLQPATCPGVADGSAGLAIFNGAPPYTITWGDGVTGDTLRTGLAAGTYSVTIVDSDGCQVSGNATINNAFPAPQAGFSPGGPVCQDSCFTFDIQLTGTPPFQLDYEVNNGDTVLAFSITPTSADTVLDICAADFGLSSGPLEVLFTILQDAHCLDTLNHLEVITVTPPATGQLDTILCAGDSLLVNGAVYSAANPSGTQVFAGASAAGCDSILTINLSFFPVDTFFLARQLCTGDSLLVNGTLYNEANPSGIELLPGATANGCDSVISVSLSFLPPTAETLALTLCPGDSVVVNGTVYNATNPTGAELFPGGSANGCDSVLTVSLSFFPIDTFFLSRQLCTGDSLLVNGTVYNEANPTGIEVLAGATANGCDSVVVLSLSFAPQVTETLALTLCPGDSVVVNGTVYNETNPTGTELFPGGSAAGCDSLVNVMLSFYPTDTAYLSQQLCEGESLTVNGTVYNEANPTGIEVLAGASANGCDSVISVSLSFLPPAAETLALTLCPGESAVVNGTIYDETNPTGTEIFAGGAANGCDSVLTVSLSFFPIDTFFLSQQLCEGESLTVNGTLYNEANPGGIELLPGASANGCDSVISVSLNFLPPAAETLALTLCPGESVVVNGTAYDEANPTGMEIFAGGAANGCDSVVTVSLSFFPIDTFFLSRQLCTGDSLLLNGTVYNEANPTGIEVLAGASANGCDSVVVLSLSFAPQVTETLVLTLCPGESVLVNGTVYNETNPTGTELFAGGSAAGCDSLVNVMLSFYPTDTAYLSQQLCAGESLTVNGTLYNEANPSGTEIFPGGAANGCDSLILVNLSFAPPAMSVLSSTLCPGEFLLVNGQRYDEDNPSGTEVIENGSVNGCDSIVQVSLSYLDNALGFVEGSTQICPGESAELTLRLQGAPAFNVELSDGSTFFNVSDGATITVAPLLTTTYEITLLTAIGSLCPVEIGPGATVTVSALAVQASVSTDYDGFGVSCAGSSDGAVLAQASGAIPPVSFNWNTGATTAALSNLPAGLYSVTVTDGAGCSGQAAVEVAQPAPITAVASGLAPDCFDAENGRIILESLAGGASPYEFSLDGQFFQGVGGLPDTIRGLAAGDYELVVQDVNDCQVLAAVTIPEAQELSLSLGENQEIRLGDSIRLAPQANFAIEAFSWSPTTGLSGPDVLEPYAAPRETTIYTLTASDAAGCSATSRITIFVNTRRDIYTPNVFSPNGDGRNDGFTLFAGGEVAEIRILRIFDRWGNLLFEAGPIQPNDETLGWDGAFNGQQMDPGVYVFYAEVVFTDEKVELVKGEVVLLR